MEKTINVIIKDVRLRRQIEVSMEHIEIKPIKDKQIQMTQVAADENVQGRGVGRSMVKYSEDFATRFGFQEMVLHARETAVPFYEMLWRIQLRSA